MNTTFLTKQKIKTELDNKMNIFHLVCDNCSQKFYFATFKKYKDTMIRLKCPFCQNGQTFFLENEHNYKMLMSVSDLALTMSDNERYFFVIDKQPPIPWIALLLFFLIVFTSLDVPFFWMIFLMLSLSVIIISIQSLHAKIQEKKAKEKRLQLNKKITCDNKSYEYVKNFVKKYKNTDYTPEALDNLLRLIGKKRGITINYADMTWLINKEVKSQNFNDFKKKILSNKPKAIENYVKNFIEIYGDLDNQEYLNFLEILLKEKNIHFDTPLVNKVKEIYEELELNHFEKKLNSDDSKAISIDDLDLITGYEFEHFLKELFQKMGYSAENTKLSGDQGADLIVSKLGEKIVIQAKRFNDKVSNKAIQEVVASIKHYQADRGMVVTNSEFTSSAIQLAESNKIELVDRDKLQKFIEKYF